MARAGYYRAWEEHAPQQAEVQLRDAIQRLCLEHRFYGTRRISHALRAEGHVVGRKRGAAADAGRQPAGAAEAPLRGHH